MTDSVTTVVRVRVVCVSIVTLPLTLTLTLTLTPTLTLTIAVSSEPQQMVSETIPALATAAIVLAAQSRSQRYVGYAK